MQCQEQGASLPPGPYQSGFPESQATGLRGSFSSAALSRSPEALSEPPGHRKKRNSSERTGRTPTSCSPAFPSLQGAFPVHFSLLSHTLSCCLGALGLPLLPQPEGALLSALDCGSSASCPDAVQGLGRSLLAKCLLQQLKGLSLLLRTHVEKLAGLVYT